MTDDDDTRLVQVRPALVVIIILSGNSTTKVSRCCVSANTVQEFVACARVMLNVCQDLPASSLSTNVGTASCGGSPAGSAHPAILPGCAALATSPCSPERSVTLQPGSMFTQPGGETCGVAVATSFPDVGPGVGALLVEDEPFPVEHALRSIRRMMKRPYFLRCLLENGKATLRLHCCASLRGYTYLG